MEFGLTPEQEAFRQEVRAWLKQELPPGFKGYEHGVEFQGEPWEFTKALAKKLAQKGWLTLSWPKEYGGLGRPLMEHVIYREEMAYHGVPGIDMGIGGVSWVGPTIMMYGTEEQKREHLPPIARGERFWCTLYSEPGTGSDLASLQSQAVADGDDYIVRGQKIWNSAAHVADWGWLAARTDPNAPKHKGISLFVVDMKSKGITVRPIITMAKLHYFNEVFFDEVRVPKLNRVGEENHGWYTLAVALDFERSGIAYSANARRLVEELTDYCRKATRNGAPLARDPLVQHRLADATIEAQVARLMAYRVAFLQSQGKVPNYEASMSKAFGTEMTQRLFRSAMSILGLHGQLDIDDKRAPLEGRILQEYLLAVSATIAAGTSEIQRNIIAQRGLGLPRS
ncbi:MAG: acyl-CoA dehydrogenase family protein [Chloroflexi bacterium]|nr:acyl-CoA dehydrogenase family protein [Chloroflexota bacterium]